MSQPSNYGTKQRKAIAGYIASQGNEHFTAAQIVEHFGTSPVRIGRTTVFRYLNEQTLSGKLRRYTTDGVSGACYQLADDMETCQYHFHLKCEECGELRHLDCTELTGIQQHVLDSHGFQVDSMKTVFYGKCRNCVQPEKTAIKVPEQ